MSSTTRSVILRADQAYYAQLCDCHNLDWGIAYSSPRYPQLAEENQFREFMIESPAGVPTAFSAVREHFAERGLSCLGWAAAADQSVEDVTPFLTQKGFHRHSISAMILREWPEFTDDTGVRILPARAMRKAMRTVFEARFADSETSIRAARTEAAEERLNDAHMDGFVAMVDDQPAAYGALFQVGDIGLMTDVFVIDSFRKRGVGKALLIHLLKLARRLLMRITCAKVPADNPAALALFERRGFEIDGVLAQFWATASDTPSQ